MHAIHEDGILDAGRSTERGNSIQGGAAAPPGKKNVIDQNDHSSVDLDRQTGRDDRCRPPSRGNIIPVHGNVHRAEVGADALDRFDVIDDPAGHLHPSRRNARDTLGIIISEAVRDGMTWAQIGQAMGVTGQAAGQMYRRMR